MGYSPTKPSQESQNLTACHCTAQEPKIPSHTGPIMQLAIGGVKLPSVNQSTVPLAAHESMQ